MGAKRTLPFDPIDEARRHWEGRWGRGDAMAAATAVMRVQQIVLGAVDEALRPFDLTFARYEALVLLQLSRKRRLPHPPDRRTPLAEITDEGREVVEEAPRAVTEAAFAMGGLSERELEQLI